MKKIAITGAPASGKTTVLWEFARLGFPTIDCDAIVHRLYFDPAVQQKILQKFDTLDKKELGKRVFQKDADRKWLERLLHPLVWREIEAWMASFARKPPLCVIEVPLLFETQWQDRFDAIIVVQATDDALRKHGEKKGWSAEQLRARQKAQLPLARKINNAHFVIDNSESLVHVRHQVIDITRKLA